MSWVTEAQGGPELTSVPTDLDEITDEEFLRQLWQQTEDFGDRRRIRARMYKLREKRLREMVQNDEESLGALHTSAEGDGTYDVTSEEQQFISSDYETSERRKSNIEVKMVMSGDSAITDTVSMQNVRLGGITMRGVDCRRIPSSDEDIINERIKEVSKGRGARYQQAKSKYEQKGDDAIVSVTKSTYSIQSDALAGDSYQSMKHKEVRDSVSPTRGAFDRRVASGDESETLLTSDDDYIKTERDTIIEKSVRKAEKEEKTIAKPTKSEKTTPKKDFSRRITERKISQELHFSPAKRTEKSSATSPTRRSPGDSKVAKRQVASPKASPTSPTRSFPGKVSTTGQMSKLEQIANEMDTSLRNEYNRLHAYISQHVDDSDEIIKEEEEEAEDEQGNVVKMIVQTIKKKDGTECTTRRVARSTKIVDKESDIDEILVGNPDHEVLDRSVEEKEDEDGSKIKIITETRRRPDGIIYSTKNVLKTSKIFDFEHPEDIAYSEQDELIASEESKETDEQGSTIRTVTETRRKSDGTEYITKKVFKTSKMDSAILPSDDDEILDTEETEEKQDDGMVIKTVIEKRRTKDGQVYTHRRIYRSRKMTLSSIDMQKGLPLIANDDEIVDKREEEELDDNRTKVKVVTETRKRKDGSMYSFDYVVRSFKGTESDIKKMPVAPGSSNIAVSEDDVLLKEDFKEELQKDGSMVKTIIERRRAKDGTEYLRHRIMKIPKLPEPVLQVGSLDDEILEEDIKEKVLDDGTHCRAVTERRKSSTTGAQYTLRRMSKVYEHHKLVLPENDEIIDENVTEEEDTQGVSVRAVIRRYQRPDGSFYTTHDIQKSYTSPVSVTLEGNEDDELIDRSYDERETDGYIIKTIVETRCRSDGTHYTIERTEKVSKYADSVQVSLKGSSLSGGSPGDLVIRRKEHEEPADDGTIVKTILEVRQRTDGTEYTNKTTIKSTQFLVPEHETSYVVIKADGEDEEYAGFFPSLDDELIYTRKKNDVDEQGNPVTVIIETRQSKKTGEKYNLTKKIHTTDIVVTSKGEKVLTNRRPLIDKKKIKERDSTRGTVPYGSVSALKDKFSSTAKKEKLQSGTVKTDQTTATKKRFFEEAEAKTKNVFPKVTTPKTLPLEKSRPKESVGLQSKKQSEKYDRSSPDTLSYGKKEPKKTRDEPKERDSPKMKRATAESPKRDIRISRPRTAVSPSYTADKPFSATKEVRPKSEVSLKSESHARKTIDTRRAEKTVAKGTKSESSYLGRGRVKESSSDTSSSERRRFKGRGSDSSSPEQRSSGGLSSPTTDSARQRLERKSGPTKSSIETKPSRGTQSPVPSSPKRGSSPLHSETSASREGTPTGRQCCKHLQESTEQLLPKTKTNFLRKRSSDDKLKIHEGRTAQVQPVKDTPTRYSELARPKSVEPLKTTEYSQKYVAPKYDRSATPRSEKKVSPTKDVGVKRSKTDTDDSVKDKRFTPSNLPVDSRDPLISLPQTPLTEEMKAYPTPTSPFIEDVSSEPDHPCDIVKRPSLVREPSDYPSDSLDNNFISKHLEKEARRQAKDIKSSYRTTERRTSDKNLHKKSFEDDSKISAKDMKVSKTTDREFSNKKLAQVSQEMSEDSSKRLSKTIKSTVPASEKKSVDKTSPHISSESSEDDSKKPSYLKTLKRDSAVQERREKSTDVADRFKTYEKITDTNVDAIKVNGYHITDSEEFERKETSLKRSDDLSGKTFASDSLLSQIIPDSMENKSGLGKYTSPTSSKLTRYSDLEKSPTEPESPLYSKSTQKLRGTSSEKTERVPVVEPVIVPKYIHPLGSDDEDEGKESPTKYISDDTKLSSTRLVKNAMSVDVKTDKAQCKKIKSDVSSFNRDRSSSPFSKESSPRPRSKESSPSPFTKEGSPGRFLTGRPIDEGPNISKIKRLERSNSNKKMIYEDLEAETSKLPSYLSDIEYITDIAVLETLLQKAESYEERRIIRGHIRNIKKSTFGPGTVSSSPAPFKRFVDSTAPSKSTPSYSPFLGRKTTTATATSTAAAAALSYQTKKDKTEIVKTPRTESENSSSGQLLQRRNSLTDTHGFVLNPLRDKTGSPMVGAQGILHKINIFESTESKPVRRSSSESSKLSRQSSTEETTASRKVSSEATWTTRKSSREEIITEERTVRKSSVEKQTMKTSDEETYSRRLYGGDALPTKKLSDEVRGPRRKSNEVSKARRPSAEDRKPKVKPDDGDLEYIRKSSNDDVKSSRKLSSEKYKASRKLSSEEYKASRKLSSEGYKATKKSSIDDEKMPSRKSSIEDSKTRKKLTEETKSASLYGRTSAVRTHITKKSDSESTHDVGKKYVRKTSSEKISSRSPQTVPEQAKKGDRSPKDREDVKRTIVTTAGKTKQEPQKKKSQDELFKVPLRHQRPLNGPSSQTQTDVEKIISPYGVGPTDENGVPLFGLKALKRRKQPSAPAEKEPEDFSKLKEEKEFVPSDSQGKPLFGIKAIRKSPPERATLTPSQMVTESTSVSEERRTATVVTEQSHLIDSVASQPATFETEVVNSTNPPKESYPSNDTSSDDSLGFITERRQRRLKRKMGKRLKSRDSDDDDDDDDITNQQITKPEHRPFDLGHHSSDLEEASSSDAPYTGETSPALVKSINESLRRRQTPSSESEEEDESPKSLKDIIKLHESKAAAEEIEPDVSPKLKPKKKIRDSFEPTNEQVESRPYRTWNLEEDLSTRSQAVENIIAQHETMTKAESVKTEKKLTGILKKTSTSSITASRITTSEPDSDDDDITGTRRKSEASGDDEKLIERKTSYTEIKLYSPRTDGGDTKLLKKTKDKKSSEATKSTLTTKLSDKRVSERVTAITDKTETKDKTRLRVTKTTKVVASDAEDVISKVKSDQRAKGKHPHHHSADQTDEEERYVSTEKIVLSSKTSKEEDKRKRQISPVTLTQKEPVKEYGRKVNKDIEYDTRDKKRITSKKVSETRHKEMTYSEKTVSKTVTSASATSSQEESEFVRRKNTFTRRDPSPSTKPKRDTFPLTKPKRDTSPPTKPKRDASPLTKLKRDTSPPTKPKRDTSPPTKPVRDTSPPTKPKRDTSPLMKPTRDISPPTKPKRDTSPLTKPKRDISPSTKPKKTLTGKPKDLSDRASPSISAEKVRRKDTPTVEPYKSQPAPFCSTRDKSPLSHISKLKALSSQREEEDAELIVPTEKRPHHIRSKEIEPLKSPEIIRRQELANKRIAEKTTTDIVRKVKTDEDELSPSYSESLRTILSKSTPTTRDEASHKTVSEVKTKSERKSIVTETEEEIYLKQKRKQEISISSRVKETTSKQVQELKISDSYEKAKIAREKIKAEYKKAEPKKLVYSEPQSQTDLVTIRKTVVADDQAKRKSFKSKPEDKVSRKVNIPDDKESGLEATEEVKLRAHELRESTEKVRGESLAVEHIESTAVETVESTAMETIESVATETVQSVATATVRSVAREIVESPTIVSTANVADSESDKFKYKSHIVSRSSESSKERSSPKSKSKPKTPTVAGEVTALKEKTGPGGRSYYKKKSDLDDQLHETLKTEAGVIKKSSETDTELPFSPEKRKTETLSVAVTDKEQSEIITKKHFKTSDYESEETVRAKKHKKDTSSLSQQTPIVVSVKTKAVEHSREAEQRVTEMKSRGSKTEITVVKDERKTEAESSFKTKIPISKEQESDWKGPCEPKYKKEPTVTDDKSPEYHKTTTKTEHRPSGKPGKAMGKEAEIHITVSEDENIKDRSLPKVPVDKKPESLLKQQLDSALQTDSDETVRIEKKQKAGISVKRQTHRSVDMEKKYIESTKESTALVAEMKSEVQSKLPKDETKSEGELFTKTKTSSKEPASRPKEPSDLVCKIETIATDGVQTPGQQKIKSEYRPTYKPSKAVVKEAETLQKTPRDIVYKKAPKSASDDELYERHKTDIALEHRASDKRGKAAAKETETVVRLPREETFQHRLEPEDKADVVEMTSVDKKPELYLKQPVDPTVPEEIPCGTLYHPDMNKPDSLTKQPLSHVKKPAVTKRRQIVSATELRTQRDEYEVDLEQTALYRDTSASQSKIKSQDIDGEVEPSRPLKTLKSTPEHEHKIESLLSDEKLLDNNSLKPVSYEKPSKPKELAEKPTTAKDVVVKTKPEPQVSTPELSKFPKLLPDIVDKRVKPHLEDKTKLRTLETVGRVKTSSSERVDKLTERKSVYKEVTDATENISIVKADQKKSPERKIGQASAQRTKKRFLKDDLDKSLTSERISDAYSTKKTYISKVKKVKEPFDRVPENSPGLRSSPSPEPEEIKKRLKKLSRQRKLSAENINEDMRKKSSEARTYSLQSLSSTSTTSSVPGYMRPRGESKPTKRHVVAERSPEELEELLLNSYIYTRCTKKVSSSPVSYDYTYVIKPNEGPAGGGSTYSIYFGPRKSAPFIESSKVTNDLTSEHLLKVDRSSKDKKYETTSTDVSLLATSAAVAPVYKTEYEYDDVVSSKYKQSVDDRDSIHATTVIKAEPEITEWHYPTKKEDEVKEYTHPEGEKRYTEYNGESDQHYTESPVSAVEVAEETGCQDSSDTYSQIRRRYEDTVRAIDTTAKSSKQEDESYLNIKKEYVDKVKASSMKKSLEVRETDSYSDIKKQYEDTVRNLSEDMIRKSSTVKTDTLRSSAVDRQDDVSRDTKVTLSGINVASNAAMCDSRTGVNVVISEVESSQRNGISQDAASLHESQKSISGTDTRQSETISHGYKTDGGLKESFLTVDGKHQSSDSMSERKLSSDLQHKYDYQVENQKSAYYKTHESRSRSKDVSSVQRQHFDKANLSQSPPSDSRFVPDFDYNKVYADKIQSSKRLDDNSPANVEAGSSSEIGHYQTHDSQRYDSLHSRSAVKTHSSYARQSYDEDSSNFVTFDGRPVTQLTKTVESYPLDGKKSVTDQVDHIVKPTASSCGLRDDKSRFQEGRTSQDVQSPTIYSSSRPSGPASDDVVDQPDTDVAFQSNVSKNEGRSFLDDRSKVTGITDVISRMGASEAVDHEAQVTSDSQARSLLNKFLGAQVLMTGVESMIADSSKEQITSHSARTVHEEKAVGDMSGMTRSSQLEKSSTGLRQTTPSSSTSPAVEEAAIVKGVNINEVTDDFELNQLLDSCEEYEERRRVRMRLKALMAEKKALQKDLSGHEKSDLYSSSRRSAGVSGSKELRTGEGELENLILERLLRALQLGEGFNLSSSQGQTFPYLRNFKVNEWGGVGSKYNQRIKDLNDTKLFLGGLWETIQSNAMDEIAGTRNSGEFGSDFIVEVSSVLDKLKKKIATSKSQSSFSVVQEDANKDAEPAEQDSELISLIDRLQTSLGTVLLESKKEAHQKDIRKKIQSPNSNVAEDDADADDEEESEEESEDDSQSEKSEDEEDETETIETVQTAILRKQVDPSGLPISPSSSSDKSYPTSNKGGEQELRSDQKCSKNDNDSPRQPSTSPEESGRSTDETECVPTTQSAILQRQPSREEARSYLSSAIVKCRSREEMAKLCSGEDHNNEGDEEEEEESTNVENPVSEQDVVKEVDATKRKDRKDLPWKIRAAKKRMEISREEQSRNKKQAVFRPVFLTQISADSVQNSKPRPYRPRVPVQSKSTDNVIGYEENSWSSVSPKYIGFFNRPVNSKSSDGIFKREESGTSNSLSASDLREHKSSSNTLGAPITDESDDSDEEEGEMFSIKSAEGKEDCKKDLHRVYHLDSKSDILTPFKALQNGENTNTIQTSEIIPNTVDLSVRTSDLASNQTSSQQAVSLDAVSMQSSIHHQHSSAPLNQNDALVMPPSPVKRPTTLNLRYTVPDCSPDMFAVTKRKLSLGSQTVGAAPLSRKGESQNAAYNTRRPGFLPIYRSHERDLNLCDWDEIPKVRKNYSLSKSKSTPTFFRNTTRHSTQTVGDNITIQDSSSASKQAAFKLVFTTTSEPIRTNMVSKLQSKFESTKVAAPQQGEKAFSNVTWKPGPKPFAKYDQNKSAPSSHEVDDPSKLLFTEEQLVKIAVHKAAINKQLSLGEANRKQAFSRSDSVGDDDNSQTGKAVYRRINSLDSYNLGSNQVTNFTNNYHQCPQPNYQQEMPISGSQILSQKQNTEQQKSGQQQILDQQQLKKQDLEQRTWEQQRVEQQQIVPVTEQQQTEKHKSEQQQMTQQELEQQTCEHQKLIKQQLDQQKQQTEQQKLNPKRSEQQRTEEQILKHELKQQKLGQLHTEQQTLVQERTEQQRREQERLQQQNLEKQKFEHQRTKQQKLEQQKLEQQRIEKQKLEQERLEQQKLEQEKLEQQKLEQQRLMQQKFEQLKLEQQKLERERLEQQKLERERIEQQKLEQERLIQQKLEQQKLERKRLEQQKLEQQRLEQQKLERERIEQQKLEQQKLEQQKLERKRLEQQKLERERIEQQKLEQERLIQQKLEQQKLERKRLELQKLEQEKLEQQKLEQERLEQQKLERERIEQQKLEQQKLEQQKLLERKRLEQQKLEQERLMQQKLEQERREQQKLEQERLVQQKLEQQNFEQRRKEQEKLDLEKLEHQRNEKQRIQQQKFEQQRLQQQKLEKQRIEQERREQQRLQQERIEQQKTEQQRLNKEQLEQLQKLELQKLQQQELEQVRLTQQKLELEAKQNQLLEQQRTEEQNRVLTHKISFQPRKLYEKYEAQTQKIIKDDTVNNKSERQSRPDSKRFLPRLPSVEGAAGFVAAAITRKQSKEEIGRRSLSASGRTSSSSSQGYEDSDCQVVPDSKEPDDEVFNDSKPPIQNSPFMGTFPKKSWPPDNPLHNSEQNVSKSVHPQGADHNMKTAKPFTVQRANSLKEKGNNRCLHRMNAQTAGTTKSFDTSDSAPDKRDTVRTRSSSVSSLAEKLPQHSHVWSLPFSRATNSLRNIKNEVESQDKKITAAGHWNSNPESSGRTKASDFIGPPLPTTMNRPQQNISQKINIPKHPSSQDKNNLPPSALTNTLRTQQFPKVTKWGSVPESISKPKASNFYVPPLPTTDFNKLMNKNADRTKAFNTRAQSLTSLSSESSVPSQGSLRPGALEVIKESNESQQGKVASMWESTISAAQSKLITFEKPWKKGTAAEITGQFVQKNKEKLLKNKDEAAQSSKVNQKKKGFVAEITGQLIKVKNEKFPKFNKSSAIKGKANSNLKHNSAVGTVKQITNQLLKRANSKENVRVSESTNTVKQNSKTLSKQSKIKNYASDHSLKFGSSHKNKSATKEKTKNWETDSVQRPVATVTEKFISNDATNGTGVFLRDKKTLTVVDRVKRLSQEQIKLWCQDEEDKIDSSNTPVTETNEKLKISQIAKWEVEGKMGGNQSPTVGFVDRVKKMSKTQVDIWERETDRQVVSPDYSDKVRRIGRDGARLWEERNNAEDSTTSAVPWKKDPNVSAIVQNEKDKIEGGLDHLKLPELQFPHAIRRSSSGIIRSKFEMFEQNIHATSKDIQKGSSILHSGSTIVKSRQAMFKDDLAVEPKPTWHPVRASKSAVFGKDAFKAFYDSSSSEPEMSVFEKRQSMNETTSQKVSSIIEQLEKRDSGVVLDESDRNLPSHVSLSSPKRPQVLNFNPIVSDTSPLSSSQLLPWGKEPPKRTSPSSTTKSILRHRQFEPSLSSESADKKRREVESFFNQSSVGISNIYDATKTSPNKYNAAFIPSEVTRDDTQQTEVDEVSECWENLLSDTDYNNILVDELFDETLLRDIDVSGEEFAAPSEGRRRSESDLDLVYVTPDLSSDVRIRKSKTYKEPFRALAEFTRNGHADNDDEKIIPGSSITHIGNKSIYYPAVGSYSNLVTSFDSESEEETESSYSSSDDENFERGGSSSYSFSRGSAQVTSQKSNFSSSFSASQSSTTSTKDVAGVSAFEKFKQLDAGQTRHSSSATSGPAASGSLFELSTSLKRSASGVKDMILTWCQCRTRDYKGVKIENFSTSWNDGLAFCALIHHFYPDSFDFNALNPKNRRGNFALAFRIADEKAGVMPLLDVDDMVMMKKPDWKCVFTYVQSLYKRLKDE